MKIISLNEWMLKESEDGIENLYRLLNSEDSAGVELGGTMAGSLLKDSPEDQADFRAWVAEQLTNASPENVILEFEEDGNSILLKISYKGDVMLNKRKKLVGDGKILIPFGKVTGNFSCRMCGLTSLQNCPTEVGGDFECFINNLTSLEGAPTKVGGIFNCANNQLTTLEGGPSEVKDYNCEQNKLVNLKGAPRKVTGYFVCRDNFITSLAGGPIETGGGFFCSGNRLKSLDGAPKKVGGNFECYSNNMLFLEVDVRSVSVVTGTITTIAPMP